jgi:hypothetical protein
VVTGHGDEWHLHGRVEDQLGAMLHTPAEQVSPLFAARGPT